MEGERVDFGLLLPVDVLLRVVLALEGPAELLALRAVSARLRRVFLARNALARWLLLHLPRLQGPRHCLLVAHQHPLRPLHDPFAPQPLAVTELGPALAWL